MCRRTSPPHTTTPCSRPPHGSPAGTTTRRRHCWRPPRPPPPAARAPGAPPRRYHDAPAALLAAPAAAAAGLEVVCHNDLSPCNFVFRAGVPVAIIDFDAAVPGTRAHDLGYAAWLWLDLGGPDVEASGQRRRLGVFLDSYGPVPDRAEVVAAILHRQDLLVAQGRRVGDTALQRWAAGCRAWTRDHLGDEAVA